jgi:SAM-dependent methyltransferase
MARFHAVVEREHEIQNPTSAEKIRLLGERLRLGPTSHVLDVASGRGGPEIILARAFGCRLTCVERAPEFDAVARERVRAAGLQDRIELICADAREAPLGERRYDAALCLGASFVWGGLAATLAALAPAVGARGAVAVGEPYWRTRTLPAGYEPDPGMEFTTLEETVAAFGAAGLEPLALIAASDDDWDRYESLHWQALEEWLHEHPDEPDAPRLRAAGERQRERYLRFERALLGWAIIAGRRP